MSQGATSAIDAEVIQMIALLVELSNTNSTRAFGVTLCRKVIRQHLRHVYHALSDDNPAHREAALHLLTAILLTSSAVARELCQSFNYAHDALVKMCGNTSKTKMPSPLHPSLVGVRGFMVGFILAHIVSGDFGIKRDVLSLVSITNAIFRGVSNDSPAVRVDICTILC